MRGAPRVLPAGPAGAPLSGAAHQVAAAPLSGPYPAEMVARALAIDDLPAEIARKNTDNQFSMAQGIRAIASGTAAGLHVPWSNGDTQPSLVAGGDYSGNNQIAIYGASYSADGVFGLSRNGTGAVRGMSLGSAAPIYGQNNSGATDTIVTLVRLLAVSSNPQAGFGGRLDTVLYTSSGAQRSASQIDTRWSSATDAIRTAEYSIYLAEIDAMTETFRLDTQDGADQTGILLQHNGTLKRVKIGPADSGGTGYRALIIDN